MRLAIIGQGGHSKVIQDIILAIRDIEIIGYFDDKYNHSYVHQGIHYGPILSSKSLLDYFEEIKFIIAIGNNRVRKMTVERLNLLDHDYAVLIHPSAIISSSAKVGYGSVIMANAVVNADADIGKYTIINTGSIVEHDTRVGDYAHISPKATLTGNVMVEEGTHIGAGATLIPQVSVGKWSTIGAGATVTRNIPSDCTAVGTPAKVKISNH
ncbi:acetyltransferase [Bacillus sp. V3B]|uniref:acetyltransferase n=1 Tax=Bacillus sp. V3B TaxID=2804915 RepID=UPI00210AD895|nr:acetyltransferase [Bacillus sp. V3B]MCQ6275285.1 acetyltransferase [Bacillus sp. V3B]